MPQTAVEPDQALDRHQRAQRILESCGLKVLVADSGRAGIELLESGETVYRVDAPVPAAGETLPPGAFLVVGSSDLS